MVSFFLPFSLPFSIISCSLSLSLPPLFLVTLGGAQDLLLNLHLALFLAGFVDHTGCHRLNPGE